MKLIVGLGNPEPKYSQTRHNVGFHMLDALTGEWGGQFQPKPKFFAAVAEATYGGERVLLAKPTTYYNETGVAVRALADFYKLSIDDILIIHDDSMLDFGKVRVRQGGRDAGNNGLKSLHRHIGEMFWHIRIGTDNLLHRQIHDIDFVLGKFNQDEASILKSWTTPTSLGLCAEFVRGNIAATSYSLPNRSDMPTERN